MRDHRIRKVLIVSPSSKSFVERDYEILKKRFRVRRVVYNWAHKEWLLSFIPRIIEGVLWADVTYSWFGSFHAFFTVLFSRLFHRKSIVVAGGYDVAKMPEINYGLLTLRLWRFFSIFSFKFCDKILAVSSYTKKEAIENLNIDDGKIEVVVHGFDKEKFRPHGKKENLVMTVGCVTAGTLLVKGLTAFAKSANLLSDVTFYLIGEGERHPVEDLRKINSRNLLYEGFIPEASLIKYMQRAKVYAQLSARESFGCALAEAMLCECTPVVTACGAIPEVVGDVGVYVPYGDVKATAEAIRRALRSNESTGRKARERIEQKYTVERREKKLIETINRLAR